MASGPLQCYALRLGPGEEIVSTLSEFVRSRQLQAAFVLTCVGSVQKARLRLANATASSTSNEEIELNAKYEIVSLVGTLSIDGGHLHISLADGRGCVTGGHVMGDLIVFTTAEIVLGSCPKLEFSRQVDDRTGYRELVVKYTL